MNTVIQHGTNFPFEMANPKWRASEDSWDTGRVKWFVPEGFGFDMGTYFAPGTVHPRRSRMVAVDSDWLENGDGTHEVTVSYQGMLSEAADSKPYRRQTRNYTQTTSGESISTADWTGFQKAEVKEALISVQDSYVTTAAVSTSIVGTAQTPPDAPTAPSFLWATLADAIYIYPKGWVLEDRQILEPGGAGISLVSDTYVYYQTVKPGDI